MKHMKHMIGCVAVAVVALILAFGFGDSRPAWVGYLLVLCCPVMMVFMMLAMRSDHSEHVESSRLPSNHRH
jgi:hypothetical protein